jgi:hypothetical protein
MRAARLVPGCLKAEANHPADVYGLCEARRRCWRRQKKPATMVGFFFYFVAPGWTVLFVAPVLLLVPAALPGAKTPVFVLPIELAAPIAFPVVP